MLDNETKRRIDTARDILVGKVPDPKSQVEQITIALIYKFMDDMDKEAVSFGGKPTFFAQPKPTGNESLDNELKNFPKYSWTKIFDPKLGGHEMLSLYSEALLKLNLNPNIPQLFRDIFKNAYLPYRDPETLKLFLKTINEFHYDHSEKLGDAFEYLLSVLGSQGDAGQFRTPRHIIDFIVDIVQPEKTETILDPACGTAGFLISSYKHILQANSKKSKGDLLTPEEKKKLMQNFTGYDISPDMVRLSLVNMYLHGFITPRIYEYDTLTSEDRWNEYFDVVIANPPFMSPKGGIKPHKKFTVKANRSEVLFVDYIAEHIHPGTGRAGIIVPEGIIFQSATAYKALRKMLVDKNYLYAVVSLPAGVFNPYSGVKTSILLMDKTLAKKTDKILFVKIENDGFDLGAQRREIDKNDLPEALNILQQYKEALQNNREFVSENKNVLLVNKKKIGEKDDYNLSIDRYRENGNAKQSHFEMVRLADVCEIKKGASITKKDTVEGNIPVIAGGQQPAYFHNQANRIGEVITVSSSGAYAGFVNYFTEPIFASDCTTIQTLNNPNLNCKFLFLVLKAQQYFFYSLKKGGAQPHVYGKDFGEIKIPLPPIEIQKQIVSKIEQYQAIINGAKQVVENYKPQIEIKDDWEMVELGSVAKVKNGFAFKSDDFIEDGIQLIKIGNVKQGYFDYENNPSLLPKTFVEKYESFVLRKGDLLISMTGTVGKEDYRNVCRIETDSIYLLNQRVGKFEIFNSDCDANYFYWILQQEDFRSQVINNSAGGVRQANVSGKQIEATRIPLPSLNEQEEIVKQIEQEQEIINGNKKLITLYEQKIKDEINKLWKEEPKEYAVS